MEASATIRARSGMRGFLHASVKNRKNKHPQLILGVRTRDQNNSTDKPRTIKHSNNEEERNKKNVAVCFIKENPGASL